jgi:hypothetical protein
LIELALALFIKPKSANKKNTCKQNQNIGFVCDTFFWQM